MLYTFAKRVIDNGNYGTKESFQLKLDVFFMGGRLSQAEYDELTDLLASK